MHVRIVHINEQKATDIYLDDLPRKDDYIWLNDKCFEVDRVVFSCYSIYNSCYDEKRPTVWNKYYERNRLPHVFVKNVAYDVQRKYGFLEQENDKLVNWTKENQ